MPLPQEVFLSHSSSDHQFVSTLAEVLRRHGVPVWYSKTNILGVQEWHDEIGAALERCDWFLLVLSPSSVDSMWVKRELQFALRQNRFDEKIVPVLYQACDFEKLSWVLPGLQYADFDTRSSRAAAIFCASGALDSKKMCYKQLIADNSPQEKTCADTCPKSKTCSPTSLH